MPAYTFGPIAGIPVVLYADDNGFILTATYQNVTINGSPLIFTFEPPVANVSEISLPGLIKYLADAILGGAVVNLNG